MWKLAQQYPKLKFTIASLEEWPDLEYMFGMDDPIEFVISGVNRTKFEGELFINGNFNQPEIEKFIQGYLEGTLPPYVKS